MTSINLRGQTLKFSTKYIHRDVQHFKNFTNKVHRLRIQETITSRRFTFSIAV